MPMLLWWGDEDVPAAGNTAYRQLLTHSDQPWTESAWDAHSWAGLQADVQQVRRTGQVVWRENLPLPLPHTPAGEFRGTFSYNPVRSGDQVVGVLMMCSRHYRASAAQAGGRFGYAEIIHSMDTGFAIVEALDTPPGQWLDYCFLEINAGWEQQTGFTITPGRRISERLPKREVFWPQTIERVLRTGVPERTTTTSGTLGRTVDVFMMRLGGPDSRQVAMLVRDVSSEFGAVQALRRSEQRARAEAERAEAERQRLNAVLEAAPAPVLVIDAQGQFVQANSKARQEWGSHPSHGSRKWVGWWADGSARHGQRLTPEEWPLARALLGQACQEIIDIASPHDIGQRKTFLVCSAPVHGEGGCIEGAVVTATDITERVRAEQALQEANRRKDEFLAMLAHELRNPLAPIRSAIELMSRPRAGKEVVLRTSAIIARQVRHMTDLVDDLLDMSRVSRGAITLHKQFIDTQSVLHDAIEQINPLLRGRKHRLELRSPEEPVLFEGDRKRVVQVLCNLLNNAVKYTPEGGHICVSTAQVAQELEIRIKDNGQGMDADTLARAFDLFAQARHTSDRDNGGLGIGLALVKKLVELHGGQVLARSDGPGRGSEFVVRLPLRKVPKLPSPHTSPASPTIEAVDGACALQAMPRRLKVLVVDDHQDGAQMLSMLIEADGHACQVRHDPADALALASCEPPDACVLDIGLPGMDGVELARRLRGQPATADALLIALSGYAQDRDRDTALAAGFDHYLVKPVEPEQLLGLLARHAAPGPADALSALPLGRGPQVHTHQQAYGAQ